MSSTLPESILIRTEHLAKTYVIGFFRKKIRAIDDVNIEVHRGEIFGLLGPNGAGKTTTLKILMGLVRPSSGNAEIFGLPVGNIEAKRRLGYLTEQPYFYDYLTGRELLIFTGQLFGFGRKECAKRADRLLEEVGLHHAATRALRRYSKGMLQRAGIAQALINDPELVVLDEPLTGLDPLGRKQLRELIAGLKQRGKTVLLSSHILSDVELLADRVAIVVDGKTVKQGPLHHLVDTKILSTEILFKPQGAIESSLVALSDLGHRVHRTGSTVQVIIGEHALDKLDETIDLIRKNGGSITAITPRQESLEDVVVRQVLGAREAATRVVASD